MKIFEDAMKSFDSGLPSGLRKSVAGKSEDEQSDAFREQPKSQTSRNTARLPFSLYPPPSLSLNMPFSGEPILFLVFSEFQSS